MLQKNQPEARPFTVDEPCRSQLNLDEVPDSAQIYHRKVDGQIENAPNNDEKHREAIAPQKEDLADFKNIARPVKMLTTSAVLEQNKD